MDDIDIAYVMEVEPETGERFQRAMDFRRSDYGKEVENSINQLETDSEKETVSLLCANEVDAAKGAATLAAACQYVRNVLWDNVINECRDITRLKETE